MAAKQGKGLPSKLLDVGLLKAEADVKKWYWPPKSLGAWANGQINPGSPHYISNVHVKTVCADYKPTISIFIKCIMWIATRPGKKSGQPWSSSIGKAKYCMWAAVTLPDGIWPKLKNWPNNAIF